MSVPPRVAQPEPIAEWSERKPAEAEMPKEEEVAMMNQKKQPQPPMESPMVPTVMAPIAGAPPSAGAPPVGAPVANDWNMVANSTVKDMLHNAVHHVVATSTMAPPRTAPPAPPTPIAAFNEAPLYNATPSPNPILIMGQANKLKYT